MPSLTGRDIPPEIWEYISHFIPSKDLCGLYSVNRAFLQLALNKHYRYVKFLRVDNRTIKLLLHVRDPDIAARVRFLYINPDWFKLHASPKKRSLLLHIRSKIKQQPDLSNLPVNVERQPQDTIHARTTSVVTFFPNITSFVINTGCYDPHPQKFPPLFLSNSWQAFSSNLVRLGISAPLKGFGLLLPAPDDLVSLQELTLHFNTDTVTSEVEYVGTETLNEVIVPFLHKLAPKLRQLSIVSSAPGDHSGLFGALGQFPELAFLELDIGFHPRHLVDPSGLPRFLCLNAHNLKDVRLLAHELPHSLLVPEQKYSHFSRWMTSNAADSGLLSGLQSLVISLCIESVLPTNLDTTITYVQHLKDTLTRLVLGDGYLSFSELETLVGTFSHCPAVSGLKMLCVKVVSLNPQLFDLLAKKLPGLDDLDITFISLLPGVKDEGPFPVDVKPLEKSDIEAFLGEMSVRTYPYRPLRALWICQRFHMRHETVYAIVKELAGSIPSVRDAYRMDGIDHLKIIFN